MSVEQTRILRQLPKAKLGGVAGGEAGRRGVHCGERGGPRVRLNERAAPHKPGRWGRRAWKKSSGRRYLRMQR
jgi:hypothetical protein